VTRDLATALDDARAYLANNPEKHKVRRGDEWQMLELDDWFLPALFHGGADSPLLKPGARGRVSPRPKCLSSLANLLRTHPERLDEARELAEESLAIKQTLDSGAAEIWKIYGRLAGIADQQSQPDRAAEYRRLAREAKRNFAGTAHEMKRHLPAIIGTLQALHDPDTADDFQTAVSRMEKRGWTNLVAAIRRILAGERNKQTLCAPLDLEDSMIIETILRAIADPTTLSALLPSEHETNT
jgi:hypothetical protein